MSHASYLRTGPAADSLTYYRRGTYAEDTVESIQTSYDFHGKITKVEDDFESKTAFIDNAVKITTVSDTILRWAIDFWSGMQKKSCGAFVATLIGGIATAIAAVTLAVLCPPLWFVAATVGVVALAALGISIWTGVRMEQASKELKQWKDPIPGIQMRRRQAQELGFYHSWKAGDKGTIVSDVETMGFWRRAMLNTNLPKVPELAPIKTFMEQSPLQNEAVKYAFGEEPEELIGILSEKFTHLKGQFDAVRTLANALKQEIQNEKNEALKKNDAWKEEALSPYVDHFNDVKQTPLALKKQCESNLANYEAELKENRLTQPEVVAGHAAVGSRAEKEPRYITQIRADLKEHETKIEILDKVYREMTAPIEAKHQANKKRIEGWAEREVRRIKADEETTLLKFHEPIEALLNAYLRNELDEDGQENVQVEFLSKTPKLETTYERPKIMPEWRQVFGEDAWNRLERSLN